MRQIGKIGVLGATGFGGSYLSVELISRGYEVVGICRQPEKLGKHEKYIPRSVDISGSSVEELAAAMADCEVVVSQYGPHTAGHQALQYMPYLEVVRKIVLGVKLAKINYFVMIGGTGSLHIPGDKYGECAVDNKDFFLAYRRALADSHAHVTYMEERLGPMGSSLRQYRNARLAEREGKATPETSKCIEEYEAKTRAKDPAVDFIKAARTSYMFFEGNTSFRWTFLSPSACDRPDAKTGRYETLVDDLPLKGSSAAGENPLDGRFLGIGAADLAIAIADEIERQNFVGKHWTAFAELRDIPGPSYVTLDQVGGE